MKKIPAILDCVAETRGVQIAGLSLLDRLIVAAHRAGCAPIYLIAKTTPSLPRARALEIDITLASKIPELDEPALLIIGVHLFWIIALRSQWRDTGRVPAISEESA